jgi:hypothetical protein
MCTEPAPGPTASPYSTGPFLSFQPPESFLNRGTERGPFDAYHIERRAALLSELCPNILRLAVVNEAEPLPELDLLDLRDYQRDVVMLGGLSLPL